MAINLVYQPDPAAGAGIAYAAGQGQYDLMQQERALREQQIAQQGQQIENQNRQAIADLQLRQYLARLQNSQFNAGLRQRGYLAEQELAQRGALGQLQAQMNLQELLQRGYEGEQNRETQLTLEEMQQAGYDSMRASQEKIAADRLAAEQAQEDLRFDRNLERDALKWKRDVASNEATAIEADFLAGRTNAEERALQMADWEKKFGPQLGSYPFSRERKQYSSPEMENATAMAKTWLGETYQEGMESIAFHKDEDGKWVPNGTMVEVQGMFRDYLQSKLAQETLKANVELKQQQYQTTLQTAEAETKQKILDDRKKFQDAAFKTAMAMQAIPDPDNPMRKISDPTKVQAARDKYMADSMAWYDKTYGTGSAPPTSAASPPPAETAPAPATEPAPAQAQPYRNADGHYMPINLAQAKLIPPKAIFYWNGQYYRMHEGGTFKPLTENNGW